mgnify:FL=1
MPRELKLTFDINTINHLGVKLYSTIPPMLAELVANAWDADSHNVWISLPDQNKEGGADKNLDSDRNRKEL